MAVLGSRGAGCAALLVLSGCTVHVRYGAPASLPLVHVSTDDERWYLPIDTPTGQQVLFFDTGYSRTTCDDALVAGLGVPVRGGSRIRGEVGAVQVQRSRLPALQLGEHSVTGVRCQVRDLGSTSSLADPKEGPIAGVLGMDVLRHFVVEIDPAGGELTLTDPATPPAPLASEVGRLYREAGVGPRLVAELAIGDRRVRPVLDTGADQTWVRGRAARLTPTHIQSDVRVRGTGAPGGELRDLAYFHVDAVGFAGETVRDLVLIDRQRPWWSDGLLGLDVLGRFHGIYDLRQRRFTLAPIEESKLPFWTPGQATAAVLRAE